MATAFTPTALHANPAAAAHVTVIARRAAAAAGCLALAALLALQREWRRMKVQVRSGAASRVQCSWGRLQKLQPWP